MNTTELKVLYIVVLFLEANLLGLIPVFSKTCTQSPRVMGLANAFSGGVFLAIAMMHILPEQASNYAALMPDAFPLPFFLTVCGYVLILLIDRILFNAHLKVVKAKQAGVKGTKPEEVLVLEIQKSERVAE